MRSVTAEDVAELDRLEAEGRLSPEAVVAEASVAGSPLAGHFEWKDGVAAHRYRLIQARELIRRCKVSISTHLNEVVIAPRYVPRPEVRRLGSNYVSTLRLRSDREQAMVVLTEELKRVVAALGRARAVAAALGMRAELDRLEEQAGILLSAAQSGTVPPMEANPASH